MIMEELFIYMSIMINKAMWRLSMELNEYKELLISTLKIMYPNYFKKKILKQLSEDGLIINNKNMSRNGQISILSNFSIDVSDVEEINAKFTNIFENDENNSIYKYIEEFEFNKGYRHSVLFKVENFNMEKLEQLASEELVTIYKKDNTMYDYVDEEATVPTIRRSGEAIVFKFSYFLSGSRSNINTESIKYVVLAIINSKDKTLEIRLDKVGFDYKNNRDFYAQTIDDIKNRLISMLGITVEDIDFKAVINYIKAEKDDVSIYAMKMHRNDTKAYLDALSNEDMVIPILGELKNFIEENKQLFDSNNETKAIGSKLNEFITGIEVNSDLPSVKMIWPENGIKIGVDHNYKERLYSFFMYYDELGDSKERMDYVREYLMQSYRQLEAETLIN